MSRYLGRPSYAGFLTDADLHSADELRGLPIYADFLVPRGFDAGAATLIAGVAGDRLMLTVEGFSDHAAAQAALAFLDGLRPHLARAAVLSAQLRLQRVQFAVAALESIGVPAAMLDLGGRVRALNGLFGTLVDHVVGDGRGRMRLLEPDADRRFCGALAKLDAHGLGSSIGFHRRTSFSPAVMHLMPLGGGARDMFLDMSAIVLIADTSNGPPLDGALLSSLFDLTPAEARVTRSLAEGGSLRRIAVESGLSIETVRSQLKQVFDKTQTRRQSELVGLLTRLGGPGRQKPAS